MSNTQFYESLKRTHLISVIKAAGQSLSGSLDGYLVKDRNSPYSSPGRKPALVSARSLTPVHRETGQPRNKEPQLPRNTTTCRLPRTRFAKKELLSKGEAGECRHVTRVDLEGCGSVSRVRHQVAPDHSVWSPLPVPAAQEPGPSRWLTSTTAAAW